MKICPRAQEKCIWGSGGTTHSFLTSELDRG